MIIDTSAILAILFGEPDAAHYEEAIAMAWPRRMSVAALLEAAMVVESRGGTAAGNELGLLLEAASIELVPVQSNRRPRKDSYAFVPAHSINTPK